MKRSLQKEPTVPWPCIQVVEWRAHGRQVLDFEMTAALLGARLESRDDGGPLLLCQHPWRGRTRTSSTAGWGLAGDGGRTESSGLGSGREEMPGEGLELRD